MNKDELNKLIAMYIIAVGTNGRPNSYVWMDVDPQMSNIDQHQQMVSALIRGGLIKELNYFLTLTEKGLALYKKIVEIYLPEVVKQPLVEGKQLL